MRYTVALIAYLILGAYLSNEMTRVKHLELALFKARETSYILSNAYLVKKFKTYKYSSPMDSIRFTSPYGYREYLNPFTGGQVTSDHKGVDIAGTWHSEIRPIAQNGVVIDKWYVPSARHKGHSLFGGYVRIRHSDDWISGYGHMSSIYVKEGDVLRDGVFYRNGVALRSGGVIGRQGNTGQSTGEHLHLSIQDDKGNFKDPMDFVDFKEEM